MTTQLKKLRNKYVASIYDGLIKRKKITEIHKELRDITLNANKNGIVYTKNMEKFAFNLAEKSKKQLDRAIPTLEMEGSLETAIALWFFDLLDKKKIFSKTFLCVSLMFLLNAEIASVTFSSLKSFSIL